MSNIIGTSTMAKCPNCGNHTVDEHGDCHYAYCDEQQIDDMEGEREFMRAHSKHTNLSEDEMLIYGLI